MISATLRTPTNKPPVLGTFSKSIEGSVSLNFCSSGGKYCDPQCHHHPHHANSNQRCTCYAVKNEKRFDRRQLRLKLKRHADTDPAELVSRALHEIKALVSKETPPPWLRIATNGSVPSPQDATPAFLKELRKLFRYCRSHSIPVHFPIETAEKTGFYRAAVKGLVVVRESINDIDVFVQARGPAACTVGNREQTRLERLEDAYQVAKLHAATTGRQTLVCPSVAARFKKLNTSRSQPKCGRCKACSKTHMDIVYPLH